MSYNKYEVKESLDLDDIALLLEYFDADPEIYDNYIIARTICHNGIGEGSKKLYYYNNSSLFHCFSGCNDSFDVFELIQKVKDIQDLNEAVFFIVNFFNLQHKLNEVDEDDYSNEDWKIFRRYEKIEETTVNDNKLVLPEYDISILKYYPKPKIISWEKDHIKKEICDYMGICYDPIGGNILIPHFDENNRCVGIRQRTLIQEQEEFGKYKPWKHRDIMYNHPLAFNLYGFSAAKDRIQELQTVVVTESEKAVLQYMSYFGTANNICVSICGSSISKYQFQMLQDLGIQEMVIAFDHDFQEVGSDEYKQNELKIAKVAKKFSSYVNVSVLFDRENILGYKDSPTDLGKDAFLYLFKNRIFV